MVSLFISLAQKKQLRSNSDTMGLVWEKEKSELDTNRNVRNASLKS